MFILKNLFDQPNFNRIYYIAVKPHDIYVRIINMVVKKLLLLLLLEFLLHLSLLYFIVYTLIYHIINTYSH
jgi:hypothetical protein